MSLNPLPTVHAVLPPETSRIRGFTGRSGDMELPEGWRVWSESDDRLILAYRPDVFDGAGFAAPCLPTLYVTRGQCARHTRDRVTPRVRIRFGFVG